MRRPIESSGFQPPPQHPLGRERRIALLAELVATIGLALSTFIAATVLSVGIARANNASAIIDNDAVSFALLIGLFVIAIGVLSVRRRSKARAR